VGPQLGLAEVAAIGVVAEISGVSQLSSLDLEQRDIESTGQVERGLMLHRGVGSTASDDGEKSSASQRLPSNHRKEGGVHASGIPEKHSPQAAQMSAQALELSHPQ
jgi:hypothetical protein